MCVYIKTFFFLFKWKPEIYLFKNVNCYNTSNTIRNFLNLIRIVNKGKTRFGKHVGGIISFTTNKMARATTTILQKFAYIASNESLIWQSSKLLIDWIALLELVSTISWITRPKSNTNPKASCKANNSATRGIHSTVKTFEDAHIIDPVKSQTTAPTPMLPKSDQNTAASTLSFSWPSSGGFRLVDTTSLLVGYSSIACLTPQLYLIPHKHY